MTPPRWRLVTVDIDGTLTRVHGWRPIAERTGRLEAFERDREQFLRGSVTESEHLERLLRLADGLTLDQLRDVLAATPRYDGIAAMVAEFHRRGTRVALLTHNPACVRSWYQTTFGFDDGAGMRADPAEGPVLRFTGSVTADKLGGLARLLERAQVPAASTVHLGDGLADAQVFPRVGAGVALNSSNPAVEAAADLVLHLEDLRELPDRLESLRPRERPGRHSFGV